jgi:hypothetical protein
MPSSAGLTYAPSHHSWSSTSSLPPPSQWDFSSPSGTPDSISSASSYFDPFNDHHHYHQSQHSKKTCTPFEPIQRRPSETSTSSSSFEQQQQQQQVEEWKWKCGQLEHTVSRLMRQVEHLRKERDDLMLESVATGTANLVFGIDDESNVSYISLLLVVLIVVADSDGG